jgi:hypothetical protein
LCASVELLSGFDVSAACREGATETAICTCCLWPPAPSLRFLRPLPSLRASGAPGGHYNGFHDKQNFKGGLFGDDSVFDLTSADMDTCEQGFDERLVNLLHFHLFAFE